MLAIPFQWGSTLGKFVRKEKSVPLECVWQKSFGWRWSKILTSTQISFLKKENSLVHLTGKSKEWRHSWRYPEFWIMGPGSLVLCSDLDSAQGSAQVWLMVSAWERLPPSFPVSVPRKDLVIQGDRIYCLTSWSLVLTYVAGEVRFWWYFFSSHIRWYISLAKGIHSQHVMAMSCCWAPHRVCKDHPAVGDFYIPGVVHSSPHSGSSPPSTLTYAAEGRAKMNRQMFQGSKFLLLTKKSLRMNYLENSSFHDTGF